MTSSSRRIAFIAAVGLATPSFAALVSPAIGSAAECGPGTVYEAATDSCVGALPPPAPPPPGDLTPGFSLGVCAPIPFVALCTGI
jgi:hypothetical protein